MLVLIKTSVWFVRIYLQNDINWGEILSSNSGPTVVGSHTGPVRALASCRGRICSASDDGFILVWPPRPAVRDEEPDPPRRLGGGAGSVWALASWGGWLISGGVDSILRVRRRRARAGVRSGRRACHRVPALQLLAHASPLTRTPPCAPCGQASGAISSA
jgi:hypothetical protein